MDLCDGLHSHCERCLATQRWGGSVTLMVVDAAFMSIGLNYFISVVPAVAVYEKKMALGIVPQTLEQLADVPYESVADIWKNRRSWNVARDVASCLADSTGDDRTALRIWAGRAQVPGWKSDPVGAVQGVGISTYQYLRMMGGVDTSMPDKIVRRVIESTLEDAGVDLPTRDDLDLIDTIDVIASVTGYRAIDLCWMTWMVQSEGKMVRMEKYRELLTRI
ncbi:MAG: hypothetical protein ACOC7M_03285 [Chloroflexota bacterium]